MYTQIHDVYFLYAKHLHARVNIKLTFTSHISAMICLGIKKNNSKKNKTINLTKIYKIYKGLTSNLFVTKKKSMVVFKVRMLLLSSKELSP